MRDTESDDCSPQSKFMEYDTPTQYTDARYLLMLSEVIFKIPPMHGVDQGDYDFLRSIADRLSSISIEDHLAEFVEE